jgi:hypothetical protein
VTLFSRERRRSAIAATFADPHTIGDALGDVAVPDDIAAWLGRLRTLRGVPFGYLVPDEAMLPPESIRFFRLDDAWVRALLDGAFSLGRDLTAQATGASANLDRAVFGTVAEQARAAAPLRVSPWAPAPRIQADAAWTGFLLRSSVVADYPGLGVNVYAADETPDGVDPQPLPVRRLDRLGPGSDTVFCLVEGDAQRVDVHEAPEVLHYGIDTPPGSPRGATKNVHTFVRAPDGTITLTGEIAEIEIDDCFRELSPRVIKLGDLAAQVAHANEVPLIDSAQMGFEMTQGVGMVTFIDRGHA